jgi:hypothetical protein
MMTACVLLAGVIYCQHVPGTRMTPEAAAALLAPRQYVHVIRYDLMEPKDVVFTGGSATSGPYGPITLSPPTRLDGTLRSQPPAVYGIGYRPHGGHRRR